MPRRERTVSNSGIYHVFVRGINKQRIFEQGEDYIRYQDSLGEVKKISGFTLYAYCLMSNHVHLLLKEGKEPLATVFRRLGVRYVHWFNKKYERSGHLFQDRYQSEPVNNDGHFMTTLIYIYQNPVKAGICTRASEYEWSSRRFLGTGNGLVDEAELVEIAPIETIRRNEVVIYEGEMFEAKTGRYLAFADKDVLIMVRQLCGAQSASSFQKLSKEKQRAVIAEIREWGVPIRQISRVTGTSKGVVEYWGKK